VAKAERWAWAGEVLAGRAEFFFDGISFWRQEGSNTCGPSRTSAETHRSGLAMKEHIPAVAGATGGDNG
jgi:hypothetical protein